jgi:hypothetical protein
MSDIYQALGVARGYRFRWPVGNVWQFMQAGQRRHACLLNLYSAGDVLGMRRAGQKQSAGLSRAFFLAPELVHKSIISIRSVTFNIC